MLFIIVPVHNRLNKTKKFIDSISKQLYSNYQIIIVDDGSKDGTTHYLEQNHPEIIVLKGDGEQFWGGGINIGLNYVRKIVNNEDHIAFANNDITFKKDTIIRLINNIEENNSAIYHPLSVNSDGYCISSGAKIILWPLFYTKHPFRGIHYKKIVIIYLVNLFGNKIMSFKCST